MSLGPPLSSWLQMLGVLALEVALVVAIATAAARWVKSFCTARWSHSSIWERTIWQVAWMVLAVLTVAEITGLGRGAVAIVRARFQDRLSVPFPASSSPAPVRIFAFPPSRPALGMETPDWDAGASLTERPLIRPASQAPIFETAGHPWPVLIWLSFSGVFLIRWLMLRVSFLWFRFRHLQPASAALAKEVADLADQIGVRRLVRVLQSIRLASPIAFGVFRPAIGLPERFGRRHPQTRRQVMLAHELAHLHSHDPEWYLLADIVLALLWWHPLAWWAQGRLHEASESAADEASLIVSDGPIVLAECLVDLGGHLSRQPLPGGLGMAGFGLHSHLARRVRLLLKINGGRWQPPSPGRILAIKAIGTCALLGALLTGAAWVQPGAVDHASTRSNLVTAWQRSPLAALLNTAIGTENPLILFTRSGHSTSATASFGGESMPLNRKQSSDESASSSTPAQTRELSPNCQTILPALADLLHSPPWKPAEKPIQFGGTDSGSAPRKRIDHDYLWRKTGDSGDIIYVESLGVEISPAFENPTYLRADRGEIFQPTPGGGDKVAIPGGPSASAHPALQAQVSAEPGKSSQLTNSPPLPAPQISKGRLFILKKLDQIIIPEIEFKHKPLSEALEFLDSEVGRHDSGGKGLNFIINSRVVDSVESSPIDVEKVLINISPPLKNLSLAQVLDVITKAADQPIQFSVEEYGVVFFQKSAKTVGGRRQDSEAQKPYQSPVGQNPDPEKPRSEPAPTRSDTTKTNSASLLVNSPQRALQEESLRREEIATVLKINLSRAVESQKKGDLASAVRFFEEVLSLGREIGGVGVEPEEKEARAGLAASRLELAYRAQEQGDFGAARAEADAILRLDPQNTAALKFKEFNQRVTDANRSRLPSAETKARILAYRERQSRIDQLVRDAQALYDAGAYDEAKSKFNDAIDFDPSNDTAFYYLRLIQDKNAAQVSRQRALIAGQRINEVGEAWTKQPSGAVPPPSPGTNAPPSAPANLPIPGPSVDGSPAAMNRTVGDGVKDTKVTAILPEVKTLPAPLVQKLPATAATGQSGVPATDFETTVIRFDLPAFYRELENAAGIDNGALAATPHEQLGSKIQGLWRNYFDKIGAQYGFHGMAPELLLQTLAGVALVRGTADETELAERFASEKFRVTSGASGRTNGSRQIHRPPGGDDDLLLSRVFRLDAEGVGKSLENVFYTGRITQTLPDRNDPNRPAALNEMLREFLAAAGADLNAGNPLATRILFNSLNGMMMVRATARDLDVIQNAVELLNIAAPQVKIEVRDFDLSAEQLSSLKPDHSLGRGVEAGPRSTAPYQIIAFLTPEKLSSVLHDFDQPGQSFSGAAPLVAGSGSLAKVSCPDSTFIDLTLNAELDSAMIDTLAVLEGRTVHVKVQNGCTLVLGLESAPKSKLHFITLTIVDSKGNPIVAPPSSTGK